MLLAYTDVHAWEFAETDTYMQTDDNSRCFSNSVRFLFVIDFQPSRLEEFD